MFLSRVWVLSLWIIGLCACDPRVPYVVLEISVPNAQIAEETQFLRVESSAGRHFTVERGDHDFPLEITLTASEPGVHNIHLDALNGAVLPLARARLDEVEFRREGRMLSITLSVFCESDGDCSDQIRCNGEEQCRDGMCESVPDPCQPPHDCVELVLCNENAAPNESPCIYEPVHSRCVADDSADGGASASEDERYCSLEAGCLPGQGCYTHEDCENEFICDGTEQCESFRCESGPPLNPDDGNPCTLDYCLEGIGLGPQNSPLTDGTRCLPADEESRDGGTDDSYICLSGQCEQSQCGDGWIDLATGEECDDGTNNGALADQCRDTCLIPACGDGVLDSSEECDDGNLVSGDGCRADCFKIEVCGDGVLDASEECDDGDNNLNPNDGCADCRLMAWCRSEVLPNFPNGLELEVIGGMTTIEDTLFFTDQAQHVVWAYSENLNDTHRALAAGILNLPGDQILQDGYRTQLNGPSALASDSLGNLYIADTYNHQIRKLNREGQVSIFAGSPSFFCKDQEINAALEQDACYFGNEVPAENATLHFPQGIAASANGSIIIADTNNHRIRLVSVLGTIINLAGKGVADCGDGTNSMNEPCFAGDNGPPDQANLAYPTAIAMDSQQAIYFVDSKNYRIRKIEQDMNRILTVAGNGQLIPPQENLALTSSIGEVEDLYINSDDRLFFTSTNSPHIWTFALNEEQESPPTLSIYLGAEEGTNFGPQQGPILRSQLVLDNPRKLSGGINGKELSFSEYHFIGSTDAEFAYHVIGSDTFSLVQQPRPPLSRSFRSLFDLVVGPDQKLYILNDTLHHLDLANGTLLEPSLEATDNANDHVNLLLERLKNQELSQFDFGEQGNLFFAATDGIFEYDFETKELTTRLSQEAFIVHDLVVMETDQAAQTIYYLSDTNELLALDAQGQVTTLAGPGSLASWVQPLALEIDPIQPTDLYIADHGGHVIHRLDTQTAQLEVYAGTGETTLSAEGLDKLQSTFAAPIDMTALTDGRLFILHTINGSLARFQIRQIAIDGSVTTVVGPSSLGGQRELAPLDDISLGRPNRLVSHGTHLYFSALEVGVEGAATLPFVKAINLNENQMTTLAGGVFIGDGELNTDVDTSLKGELIQPVSFHLLPDTSSRFFVSESATGIKEVRLNEAAPPNGIFARIGHPFYQGSEDSSLTSSVPVMQSRARPATAAMAIQQEETGYSIYLIVYGDHRIQRVVIPSIDAPENWTRENLTGNNRGATDGPLSQATFHTPRGLSYIEHPIDASSADVSRMLYVADSGNHCIRAIDLDAQTVTTIVGTCGSVGLTRSCVAGEDVLLNTPKSVVALPDGRLYIADTNNHQVLVYFPPHESSGLESAVIPVAGTGEANSGAGGFPATEVPIASPQHLSADQYGNIYASSRDFYQISGPALTLFERSNETCETLPDHYQATIRPVSTNSQLFPIPLTCTSGTGVTQDNEIIALDECLNSIYRMTSCPEQ